MFKSAKKRQEPLRQALEFEMDLLRKIVEKVATLDTEVKLRGRKGATFPS